MLQNTVTKKRCAEAGLDFIGSLVMGMREMHQLVCTVFNREDAESKAKAHWLIKTLIKECAEHGWREYRTHLALMDQVAEIYCFNDRALMKRNERVEDALDPKGVLAPGKNGVWPKGYDKDAFRIKVQSGMGAGYWRNI